MERTRTPRYSHSGPFFIPKVSVNNRPNSERFPHLIFQFGGYIASDFGWNCTRYCVTRKIYASIADDCINNCSYAAGNKTNTYCENDTDSIFASMDTISLMILRFEPRVISSHTFRSCVPAASSIMMYSEPTELWVVALHLNTRGAGMWRIVQACSICKSFRVLCQRC